MILPSIPNLANPLRRIMKKSNTHIIFSSGSSLSNILCNKNKVELPPRQIIYKAHCPSRPEKNNAYIGQSRRTLESRLEEHKGYIRRGEWAKSGLAAHKEQCDATINWEDVEILSKIKCKSKKQLPYKLDYMESLNIKLHKTGPGNGFNEDEGRRFFTKQWDPLLADLRKKMELE